MSAKKRVLVVEDNLFNMELVTDLLEANGYAVWQARTAEEGLQRAKLLPDLILMDISLPGMDGLTAIRSLRANPATAHLPVIALTAHAMRGDEETALGAGCDSYLTKPINTRTFAQSLAEVLETAGARQTLTATT